jgi:hypothetical protein
MGRLKGHISTSSAAHGPRAGGYTCGLYLTRTPRASLPGPRCARFPCTALAALQTAGTGGEGDSDSL